MMTRTRQILQAAQNGGKHCPSMLQKRGCQGYRCHGHHDKKILREMALLLPAALSHNRHVNDSSDSRHNLRTRYRDSYKHNRDHEYCVEFEVIKASKACHKLPPYNLMLEGDRIIVRCDLEALVQDKEAATGAAAAAVSKQSSGRDDGTTAAATTTTTTTSTSAHKIHAYVMEEGDESNEEDNDDEEEQHEKEEEEETEEDDAQNVLETDAEMAMGAETEMEAEAETEKEKETGSNESSDFKRQRQLHRQRSATSKRSATPIMPQALQQQQQQQQQQEKQQQQQHQQQLLLSYHCRGEGLSGRTTRWSALPAPSCRGKWLRLTIGPPKKCNHAQFTFV